VRAGELRHRLTVQQRTQVSDGHDGFTESWASVAGRVRMPGRVKPLQGRELERAQQVDKRISHTVELRYWRAYRADLKVGATRLVYHDRSDRTFEVIGPPVDVGELHEKLLMTCTELA
jgi:SPP1 family predicted phage head-tail adaptor